jgi:hypothetical protein
MNYLAILCAVWLINETAPFFGDHPQFVRGEQSGVIYKACWTPTALPDSATHINIHVGDLAAMADQIPTLGKSLAISGIDNPAEFLRLFGLVRCDENGNDLEIEE